jgi:ribosomal protein S14
MKRRDTLKGYTDPVLATLTGKPKHAYWRLKLWERDGGRCGVCGEPVALDKMDVDHIIPEREGGPTHWDNLRPTHPPCNRFRPTTYAEQHGLVRAPAVMEAFGIPRSALYELAEAGRIPFHDRTECWHTRRVYLFNLSEVRAALGLPEPPPA